MLDVSIDTTPLQVKLALMQQKLAGFPEQMATELTAWQSADMKRKYPNTALQDNAAETSIWPRSRIEDKQKRKLGVRLLRRRMREQRARVQPIANQRPKSTRAILRDDLYDKLVDRMNTLLETLSWR